MERLGSLDRLYPDPTQDVAGLLGLDCFLCGLKILRPRHALTFGKVGTLNSGDLYPQLPCHAPCLNERPVHEVELEYLRRIHDLVGLPRVH